jgi:glyoxylase-like metal-dependent hydrolase (beta-lactamase superfamily II)
MGIALGYMVAAPPEQGILHPIAPDITWLRMTHPFDLDHINLWVLDDDDGVTLVDTGLARRDSKGIWRNLLKGELARRPVESIVVTHFHPDLVGMASWLANASRFEMAVTSKSTGETGE